MLRSNPNTLKRQRIALWRLAWARVRFVARLLRDFRATVILFIAATFGAGLLYALLEMAFNIPLQDRIPVAELPLVMAQMMTLQASIPTGGQLQLLGFWYVMPLIGLLVLGGVVQFIQILFDQSGRAVAWQEAWASVMDEHTIVAGTGHVGLSVIQSLIGLGAKVVALNLDFDDHTATTLTAWNVPMIIGDASTEDGLRRAGIQHAESLVISTSEDAVNLQIALRARYMNKSLRVIVRAWDSQYREQLQDLLGIERVVSSAELSGPVFAGAALGFDLTQTVDVRVGKAVRTYVLMRLEVGATSAFLGRTIGGVQDRYDVDIVLYQQDGTVDVHPTHEQAIGQGDTLVLFTELSRALEVASLNRPLVRG
jgi:Trk K+ transport system NAD-binding subunit